MPTDVAERLQRSRDLKQQMAELKDEDDQEIIFKDTSRRRAKVLVYSMSDGEPIEMDIELAKKAIEKQLTDGQFMFTMNKEDAPEYRFGEVKCFLHPESKERPVLNQIGLAGITCASAKLANAYSKRIHAQHRHKQQWSMYQEHVQEMERETERNERREQTDAMLAMAGRAAWTPVLATEQCTFEGCDYSGTKAQVVGHSAKHKAEVTSG